MPLSIDDLLKAQQVYFEAGQQRKEIHRQLNEKFSEILAIVPGGWRVVLIADPQVEATYGTIENPHLIVASVNSANGPGTAIMGVRADDKVEEWNIPMHKIHAEQ